MYVNDYYSLNGFPLTRYYQIDLQHDNQSLYLFLVAGARLPLTTLTASIKQLTVTESVSSSTTTSHVTEQTAVQLNKQITGSKHSDPVDLVDGLCLSRNSSSYAVSNHSVVTNKTEPAENSAEMDFDSVGRTAMLTHPTASRVRAPRRRPPSTVNVTVTRKVCH